MPTFLLDANLSPKTARYLATTFGLDVVSLLALGLGELPDHDVIQMARSTGRIIITLDEDFTQPYSPSGDLLQGIIYLDLPNTHRHLPRVNRILDSFFRSQAATIDLEHSLVVITEDTVSIVRR